MVDKPARPVDVIKIDSPFAQRIRSLTADSVIEATTELADKLDLVVGYSRSRRTQPAR